MRGGPPLSTWLDLAGSLLVIAGVSLFVAFWSIPAALVVAGVLLLLLSLLVDWRAARESVPQD